MLSFVEGFVPNHTHLRKINFLPGVGKNPRALLEHGSEVDELLPLCPGIRDVRYTLSEVPTHNVTFYGLSEYSRTDRAASYVKLSEDEGEIIFHEERTPALHLPLRASRKVKDIWSWRRHPKGPLEVVGCLRLPRV